MPIKTFLTRPLRRAASAAIAGLVTTFIAIYAPPMAQAAPGDCRLRDAVAWQIKLTDPQEEATPEYVLRVTEAFIKACPNRPERPEAHKIAGMAATDIGEATRAVSHFAQAGWLHSDWAKLYHAAALLANQQPEAAWSLRDIMVAEWLDEMAHNREVMLSSEEVRGGTIHAVRFARPDADNAIVAAWLAVPDGAGWPATLSIGAARQITAIHRLAAGAQAPPLHHVDLYRCRSRRLLAPVKTTIPVEHIKLSARETLIGYLANPDPLDPDPLDEAKPGGPIAVCLWPSRLFPHPSK